MNYIPFAIIALSYANAQTCPFNLAPFNCHLNAFPRMRQPWTRDEISVIITNPNKTGLLNFAAPVLELYPIDIGSIAVFGDSVSAGLFVESSLLGILFPGNMAEARHDSWSNGGTPHRPTIFNLLRQYSPSLYGGSYGSTNLKAIVDDDTTGFDFAVSLARASDLTEQVHRYIAKLSQLPKVSSKWKLANILIGANNMCTGCMAEYQRASTPYEFEKSIRQALKTLENAAATGRKMLVNLIGLFDITPLKDIGSDMLGCTTVRRLGNLCRCLRSGDSLQLETIRKNRKAYNEVLKRISREYQLKYLRSLIDQYETDTQTSAFVVFYQSALEDFDLRAVELSLLSKVDCFHPNSCGQTAITFSIFNSYFSPTDFEKKSFVKQVEYATRKTLTRFNDPTGEQFQKGTVNGQRSDIVPVQTSWQCPNGLKFFM